MAKIDKIVIFAIFSILMLSACKTKNQELEHLIAELETLHCQAKKLKDSRFELSDYKREVEASIPFSQTRLDSIGIEAEKLKNNSLELAKVIKSKTDIIINEKLNSEKDKALFDEKINQFGQNCK